MPITTSVVVKSIAAMTATGLGILGGFNYVSGGSVFGTGNDYPMLPPPTSISSVSAGYTPYTPYVEPTPSTATEETPAQPDASCCLAPSRAGFLLVGPNAQTDAQIDEQSEDRSDAAPEREAEQAPPANQS